MVKKLEDKEFENFINCSFYSAVGFYYPSAEKEEVMLKVLEEFAETRGNVACGIMDVIEQNTPGDYGIGKDESPIIVLFKQGNAFKAITDFSVESIENAITPPGKNITLQ